MLNTSKFLSNLESNHKTTTKSPISAVFSLLSPLCSTTADYFSVKRASRVAKASRLAHYYSALPVEAAQVQGRRNLLSLHANWAEAVYRRRTGGRRTAAGAPLTLCSVRVRLWNSAQWPLLRIFIQKLFQTNLNFILGTYQKVKDQQKLSHPRNTNF